MTTAKHSSLFPRTVLNLQSMRLNFQVQSIEKSITASTASPLIKTNERVGNRLKHGYHSKFVFDFACIRVINKVIIDLRCIHFPRIGPSNKC